MLNEMAGHFDQSILEWVNQVLEGQNPFPHVSEEKLQEAHTLAYFLYQRQEYQEASHFFRLLAMVRPAEAKYWKGLGACLQMQQDYEEALNCYMSSQLLHQDKPDPYLYVHAADCYFALKESEKGLKMLEAVRLIGEKNSDMRLLKHVKFMNNIWSK